MTEKEFVIDDIKERIYGYTPTPSCEVCGFNWSFARISVSCADGDATLHVCEHCHDLMARAETGNRDKIYQIDIEEKL